MRVFLLWWLAGAASAAAPLVLTHSGRLTSTTGQPIDGATDVRVTLFGTETATSGFWTRLYDDLPVEDGYFAVSLVTSDTSQPLNPTDFLDGDTWVGVQVGGVDVGPRQRLGSVPYALVAGSGGGSPFFCSTDGGTWCPDGYVCGGGTCTAELGLASSNPATTCNALHTARPAFHDGVYWLDPDGVGTGNAAFRAYCLMDDATGGWTLVARVNGADANTLLYPAWTSTTLGATTDFTLTGTSDVLYDAYGKVPGAELLFYDGTALCGSDRRLLQTGSILGNKNLKQFLADLTAASDPDAATGANFFTPAFRNTGCSQPFNPSGGVDYFTGNKLAINVYSTDSSSTFTRFTINRVSYDNGIGGYQAADGSYASGDLDSHGDGVNNWSGHIATIFVR
jgi:hypothetical protein